MKVECQNCGWTGDESACGELPERDILERVGPGEIMPVGECPDCDAVCHYLDVPEGGAFAIRAGRPSDGPHGVLGALRFGDYELAEAVAEGMRGPGRWASVEELDAFARGPAAPLFMKPDIADDMGAKEIQPVADRFGVPVIILPGSRYHAGRVFWPAPAAPPEAPAEA